MRLPPPVPAAVRAEPTLEALGRQVESLGRAHGLDAVGIAPASPLTRARQILDERKAAGLHGGMEFTYRNPARSTSPDRVVPDAAAIVVGARRYASHPPAPAHGIEPAGRVARYAWTDHYAPLREALKAVALHLRAHGHRAVVVADDNAMVDREVAYRAGIGWFGKNANLLLPGAGSWFVLGAVVTDAPLPVAGGPVPDGCGTCRRCLDACPTGAIVAPGVVDARRCLAWLVQQPGTFPRQHRLALHDRIYGCDDCQEVCPPNLRFDRTAPPTLKPAAPSPGPWVPLLDLLAAGDDELLARYGRWYLAGRDPRWLRRNALIALGNIGDRGDERVVAALQRHLRHTDPMLRSHAAWAARRLGRHDLLDVLVGDDAPDVVDELAAPDPPVPVPT